MSVFYEQQVNDILKLWLANRQQLQKQLISDVIATIGEWWIWQTGK